jgi:hypothetical protein
MKINYPLLKHDDVPCRWQGGVENISNVPVGPKNFGQYLPFSGISYSVKADWRAVRLLIIVTLLIHIQEISSSNPGLGTSDSCCGIL